MILVDTGPLIALFNPRDAQHAFCRTILQTIRERLVTTVAVLTEAFHMLGPASHGCGSQKLITIEIMGFVRLHIYAARRS